jgi:hypothetical protein
VLNHLFLERSVRDWWQGELLLTDPRQHAERVKTGNGVWWRDADDWSRFVSDADGTVVGVEAVGGDGSAGLALDLDGDRTVDALAYRTPELREVWIVSSSPMGGQFFEEWLVGDNPLCRIGAGRKSSFDISLSDPSVVPGCASEAAPGGAGSSTGVAPASRARSVINEMCSGVNTSRIPHGAGWAADGIAYRIGKWWSDRLAEVEDPVAQGVLALPVAVGIMLTVWPAAVVENADPRALLHGMNESFQEIAESQQAARRERMVEDSGGKASPDQQASDQSPKTEKQDKEEQDKEEEDKDDQQQPDYQAPDGGLLPGGVDDDQTGPVAESETSQPSLGVDGGRGSEEHLAQFCKWMEDSARFWGGIDPANVQRDLSAVVFRCANPSVDPRPSGAQTELSVYCSAAEKGMRRHNGPFPQHAIADEVYGQWCSPAERPALGDPGSPARCAKKRLGSGGSGVAFVSFAGTIGLPAPCVEQVCRGTGDF